MENIVTRLSSKKSFRARVPANINLIQLAEEKLKLKFSEEYKEYLISFGQATIFGHEFSGITDSLRLNVVDLTIEEKEKNPYILSNMYVIEKANIDDIVIWQNDLGEIFLSESFSSPSKIATSFLEYIDSDYI